MACEPGAGELPDQHQPRPCRPEQHIECAVIHPARPRLAGVITDEIARIQGQLARPDLAAAKQAEVMLAVDLVQLAILVAEHQVRTERVIHAAHAEVVSLRGAAEAPVLVDQASLWE